MSECIVLAGWVKENTLLLSREEVVKMILHSALQSPNLITNIGWIGDKLIGKQQVKTKVGWIFKKEVIEEQNVDMTTVFMCVMATQPANRYRDFTLVDDKQQVVIDVEHYNWLKDNENRRNK